MCGSQWYKGSSPLPLPASQIFCNPRGAQGRAPFCRGRDHFSPDKNKFAATASSVAQLGSVATGELHRRDSPPSTSRRLQKSAGSRHSGPRFVCGLRVLAGPRMGCGASAASAQRADAAGSGYSATEPRESAASRPAAPLVVDVESARALAPGAAAAGPPSLNTLEAKHSSLADNWEKQRRESQKVQRQSSRDAG